MSVAPGVRIGSIRQAAAVVCVSITVLVSGCRADSDGEPDESVATSPPIDADVSTIATTTFVAEVWADNWFALYANGELVGEDSVPITTERSFNAETITFEAISPLTLAVEAKDFKETDSGIEYIGEGNQQMGDGGFILQVKDAATGVAVAVTDGRWSTLVIHRAPLDKECERSADPDSECEYESSEAPDGWTEPAFDDAAWTPATVWGEADVSPKDGYDQIVWVPDAVLVWGTDLEVDNTVLFRFTLAG
jgi:hypothetical protein